MEIEKMTKKDLTQLIRQYAKGPSSALMESACAERDRYYGKRVFIRGLIEFTNYCKNDCYYCGIRCQNKNINRYRLTEEQILACCDAGAGLGLHTFVLQGGEDPYFTTPRLCSIITKIKKAHPNAAVTLSVGEKNKSSYEAFLKAGADRYLLRHETASASHYNLLHPSALSLQHRKECLWTLKRLGYQTGAGFMVGSPGQTAEHLAEDLLFLKELQPQMVGIGPFIPHQDTPFAAQPPGSLPLVLTMLVLTRLMLPKVLLPATTALATLSKDGRELGFSAGCNVVMPNLSPAGVRSSYALYDKKAISGAEAAQNLTQLKQQIEAAGLEMDLSRGDAIPS